MKQRKDGKKVYNWHRPLGPDALKRGYIRERDQLTGIDENLASLEDYESDFSYDPWTYTPGWDCCEACFNEDRGFANSSEVETRRLELLLQEVLLPSFWKLHLEDIRQTIDGEEREEAASGVDRKNSLSLEDRLYRHVALIRSYATDSETLRHELLTSIGDQRGLKTIETLGRQVGSPNLAKLICLFAPFWLREPNAWDAEGGHVGLLRHLFVQYDTPWFLYPAWMNMEDCHPDQLKWLVWFILMGQGGSLKQAAKRFGWKLTRSYTEHLNQVPADTDCIGAVLFAEVKRLGGSQRVYERLSGNAVFVWDPTNPEDVRLSESGFEAFWRETVLWLSQFELEFTDEQCDDVLAWAVHEYTEARREGGKRFTWKGRSPTRALERANRYHQELARPWQNKTWPKRGWDWQGGPNGEWEMIELATGEELYEEGRKMRHCVSGYVSYCMSGSAAIFSLRVNGERALTVQIEPARKVIAQARGICNRAATKEEKAVLEEWREERVRSDPASR